MIRNSLKTYFLVLLSVTIMLLASVTVFAEDTCKISFSGNGAQGQEMDSITVSTTEPFTLPDCDFERPNNSFLGWGLDPTGKGKVFTKDDQVIISEMNTNDNIMLYAIWSGEEYKIKYIDSDNGEEMVLEPTTYLYGEYTRLPAKLEMPGKKLIGWTDESGERVSAIGEDEKGEKVFYAEWKRIDEYTISYDLNGGKLPRGTSNPTKYTYGMNQSITLVEPIPPKEATGFLGWYDNKDWKNKGNKVTVIDSTTWGNKKLYAVYDYEKYNITYIMGENAVNHEDNADEYATLIGLKLKNPKRDGYSFLGWYTEPEFTNKISRILKGTKGDITLYARWREKNASKKKTEDPIVKYEAKTHVE